MAQQEVIFAGFGGQGILSMGKFLAYAGMDTQMNVSWCPLAVTVTSPILMAEIQFSFFVAPASISFSFC